MTTPVAEDDLVQGCVKWLSTLTDVTALLGRFPYTHTPYLFQRQMWVNLENSSSTACVVSYSGGWTGPNQHNTMRFPRLLVEVTVDPLRDDAGMFVDPAEADRRLEAVYKVLDRHLHRPQSGTQMWGNVRTIASTRLAEPITFSVPDGGGMRRLQVFYGVMEG